MRARDHQSTIPKLNRSVGEGLDASPPTGFNQIELDIAAALWIVSGPKVIAPVRLEAIKRSLARAVIVGSFFCVSAIDEVEVRSTGRWRQKEVLCAFLHKF